MTGRAINREDLIATINRGIASGAFTPSGGDLMLAEPGDADDCRKLYSADQLYVQRFSRAYLDGFKWARDGASEQDPDDPDLFMPAQNTAIEAAAFRDGYRNGMESLSRSHSERAARDLATIRVVNR